MKRKRNPRFVFPIQELPVEIFYHCMSWVPIREVIIGRKVSPWWKACIDSWYERFRTLSIMYDGPACFDPMNCPFEMDAYLVSDSLACMRSPPYALHVSRVLIGDALFQKEKFRDFYHSQLIESHQITSVALRATLCNRDQIKDFALVVDQLGNISDIAIDASDMRSPDGVDSALRILKDARPERLSIYLPQLEDTIFFAFFDVARRAIRRKMFKLCTRSNLEGFGWMSVSDSLAIASTSRNLRSFGIPTPAVDRESEPYDPIEARHLATLESLRFYITLMEYEDDELSLCSLVDKCTRLRHAVLDIDYCDDAELTRFPWYLVTRLAGNGVTSIRIRLHGRCFTIRQHHRSIADITSFRRVELAIDANMNMREIFATILNKIKNIEVLAITRQTYFLKGEVDYLCRKSRAKTILIHGVDEPLSSVYGYTTKRYHSGSVILTRKIRS